jgi:hypothetical protein
MDGIRFGLDRYAKDRIHVEVRLGCGGGSDNPRLICLVHVEGVAIEFGVDRNRPHPHLAHTPNYSYGDFATIGDED